MILTKILHLILSIISALITTQHTVDKPVVNVVDEVKPVKEPKTVTLRWGEKNIIPVDMPDGSKAHQYCSIGFFGIKDGKTYMVSAGHCFPVESKDPSGIEVNNNFVPIGKTIFSYDNVLKKGDYAIIELKPAHRYTKLADTKNLEPKPGDVLCTRGYSSGVNCKTYNDSWTPITEKSPITPENLSRVYHITWINMPVLHGDSGGVVSLKRDGKEIPLGIISRKHLDEQVGAMDVNTIEKYTGIKPLETKTLTINID